MAAGADRRLRVRPGKFLDGLVEELIAWAGAEFRNRRRGRDGATKDDHAAASARIAARLGGKPQGRRATPAAPPSFPADLAYLWGWFVELLAGAAPGFGPAQPGWLDVDAWSRIAGVRPEPWEARCLVRLGALRASVISEETEREARHGDRDKG